jgi:selenoprotein W-related protein
MTTVTIEYCVPCGLLDPAIETQRHLLETFGRDLDGVRLEPGHGGVFRVSAGGERLWDKNEDGGIDVEAIADALEARSDGDA